MKRLECMALAVLAAITPLVAGQTRTWSQGEMGDFEKGVIKNLSLRSDGLLMLAPKSHEVAETSSPFLWALARDSKGNLYAGGGTGAKLYEVGSNGKLKVLAELEGLEIHALAIDSKDRVYAATSPDGRIYRVAQNGKSEVFFDPKAKYIWAMTFDSAGDLLVATGDRGEIWRVKPDGKGSVWFKTDETHVRSLTIDAADNVIAGTEPGGLVIRVSAAGEGFVLHQLGKKEVTAVLAAPDGSIYAAGVANKQAGMPMMPVQPTPAPAQIVVNQAAGAGAANAPQPRPVALPPTFAAAAVMGGSEVVRIDPRTGPRRIWSHPVDVVYALALDREGRLIVGTGNKGVIYRVDSPVRFTQLLTLAGTQVTAFGVGAKGSLLAATGNVGKVFEIGPGLEPEGTFESDVFDAGMFTAWGRLSFEAKMHGGTISIATRSGNLDQPQKNWSRWSAPISQPKGEAVTSPAARFVQWKATLKPAGDASPELESVDVAYLPRNVEPRVEEIEITPPNYKFPPPSSGLQPAQTLSLPPLGRQRNESPQLTLDAGGTSTPALTLSKGAIGARWVASDPNGDSLLYTVEIRGEQETAWKLLKDKLREKYFSWDGTAFPDGEYRLRITASDAPSNPPALALASSLESDMFVIDNTPPRITGLAASRSGAKVEVKWHAADALNHLKQAEYSLDGGEWTVAAPVTGLSDSQELDYVLVLNGLTAGEHTIAVRVADDYDNQSVEKTVVR